MESNQIIVPFLKWAGGKRWLVANHSHLFPDTFERYCEPFLGSGAVYFHLKPGAAVLSDLNKDLVDTYKAIRANYGLVKKHLVSHQKKHSKKYYYEVRSSSPRSIYQRAARLIYLNRTCWNALYRVNKQGQFNVPIGTKDAVLLESDSFSAIADLLSKASISDGDFSELIKKTRAGDFVFVDPPYTVKHNYNGFLKYNEQIFSWDDQERLHEQLLAASRRGAKIMITNADHSSIRSLYKKEFDIRPIERASVIAAASKDRSIITELVITNY